jgi:hypothetical protein
MNTSTLVQKLWSYCNVLEALGQQKGTLGLISERAGAG